MLINNLIREIDQLPDVVPFGRVAGLSSLLVEIAGLDANLVVGDACELVGRDGNRVPAQIVGMRGGRAIAMPFGTVEGIGFGSRAERRGRTAVIDPHRGWLGRVIDAFGAPLDGRGPLPTGGHPRSVAGSPPPAGTRNRIGKKLDVGVRAINAFLTCCRGQRMGIFAGSGVGKSSLLSMMARHTEADVRVVGLIGERGREAREFVEDELGPEAMAKSVVVVATSDAPPLVRRNAAYAMMTIAEYFREQGDDVLCLMDSVTRFATAQREIGLAMGEPPTSKGYTPSVFAELPRLLERAGPGIAVEGSITGIFTVLVEGDDHNEPVADAVRSILDGHIVLDRAIAERNRFPAINIVRSVSRMLPGCNSEHENSIVSQARRLLATYEEMHELVRLGAYRSGSDPAVDEAVRLFPALDAFLGQSKTEQADFAGTYDALQTIVAAGGESAALEAGR